MGTYARHKKIQKKKLCGVVRLTSGHHYRRMMYLRDKKSKEGGSDSSLIGKKTVMYSLDSRAKDLISSAN